MDDNLKQLLMPAVVAFNLTGIVVMGIFYFTGDPLMWSKGAMMLRILGAVVVGGLVGAGTFFFVKSKQ